MKRYKLCLRKKKFIIILQAKHGGAIDYGCYNW